MKTQNSKLKQWGQLLILILPTIIILSVLSTSKCSNPPLQKESYPVIKSDTVIRYKYLEKWYPLVIKPQPPKDSISYNIPAAVDTMAILQKFYTEYFYQDTIQDTNIIAVSSISVFENRIKTHRLDYKLLLPAKETIIANTIERGHKPMFLIGAVVDLNNERFNGFGPELLLVTKRQYGYGIGYNLVQKTYSIRLYFPIRFSNGKNKK